MTGLTLALVNSHAAERKDIGLNSECDNARFRVVLGVQLQELMAKQRYEASARHVLETASITHKDTCEKNSARLERRMQSHLKVNVEPPRLAGAFGLKILAEKVCHLLTGLRPYSKR